MTDDREAKRAADTARMSAWRAAQCRAGRKIVRGRIVDQPRVNRRAGEEPPHGTPSRYNWRADPCRCARCTEANRIAVRLNRQGLPATGILVRTPDEVDEAQA